MVKKNLNCLKLIALAAALPFIYGCGAGTSSLTGFLFGSGGGGIGDIVLGGGGGVAGGGGLATLSQPEPASMLLVGGGLMAMSYFKSKKDRHSK